MLYNVSIRLEKGKTMEIFKKRWKQYGVVLIALLISLLITVYFFKWTWHDSGLAGIGALAVWVLLHPPKS